MAVLEHPTLGKIEGKSGDGVIQYLGIEYASLKDRFAAPVLAEYPGSNTIDATKLGPACLTPPGNVDFELSLIQHTLPHDEIKTSDIHGLNLNISVPEGITASSKRPVFVFIHGGGFAAGAGSFPVYDFARLVKFSADKGLPAIGISINYRVGAPGFLTSKELQDAGYKTNNGLRDQRVALQWVQKHIAGFGGDASNVTLFGESAGGVSVSYQLDSEQPLFKKAMLMSGTDLLIRSSPPSASEAAYATVLKALDLDSKSPSERVSALVSLPANEFLPKIPRTVELGPVTDNDISKTKRSYTDVSTATTPYAAASWCEAIALGDCAFDGSIMGLRIAHLKPSLGKTFTSAIKATLPDDQAAALLHLYALTPETNDEDAFVGALRFANDICFYAPTLAYARGWSKASAAAGGKRNVYVYRFNEPNPWPGQWTGEAIHIQDIAFLSLNFGAFLDAGQRAAAEGFAERFLRFVAGGQEPWEPWRVGKEKALLIAGGRVEVVDDRPEEVGRRKGFVELLDEVGFEALSEAWNAFISSKL